MHVFASSYDLDWIVPQSSEYALLFVSRGFYGGTIYIKTQVYSTFIQSQPETYTTTIEYTFQSEQIITSTLLSSNPQTSSADYRGVVLIVAIIAVVLVSLACLRLRKRRVQ